MPRQQKLTATTSKPCKWFDHKAVTKYASMDSIAYGSSELIIEKHEVVCCEWQDYTVIDEFLKHRFGVDRITEPLQVQLLIEDIIEAKDYISEWYEKADHVEHAYDAWMSELTILRFTEIIDTYHTAVEEEGPQFLSFTYQAHEDAFTL